MGWNQYYVLKHALFTKYNVFCTNLPVFWKSTRKFGQSEIALPYKSAIMEVILEIIFWYFFFQKHTKGGQKR